MNISTLVKRNSYIRTSKAPEATEMLAPNIRPADSVQLQSSEVAPDVGRMSQLSAGLNQTYASPKNIGVRAQEKTAKDLKSFEERLDPAAREAFRGLDKDKQIETMKLGKVFAGNNLGGSSLVKLMQDGRLYEKDSSGMTPLQRLSEVAQPDRPDFQTKGNFVTRMLDAIENPTKSSDAQKKFQGDAAVNPSEFIRKAGEEYNDDDTLQRPSDWDRSVSEG